MVKNAKPASNVAAASSRQAKIGRAALPARFPSTKPQRLSVANFNMLSELDLLLDVTNRLEEAGFDYMLTDSMALNHYAQPRMTRDIDIVLAFYLKDLETLPQLFGDDFYYSEEAARQAILNQSSFNVIHNESLIKIDFMIRKREEYREVEFQRRQQIAIKDHTLWIIPSGSLVKKTSSSPSSTGPANLKANGNSLTSKTSSPPELIKTTFKYGLKN